MSVPAQAMFTVVAVVVGWIGWRIVETRAKDPHRLLRILVPVIVLVSLLPDLLLLVFPVIPETNAQTVIVLMHLVVAACAVSA